MRGDSTPFISSFNDYLTAILPICFGALNMTADEIRKSTPWEISQRIKGYEYRKRQERIFVGSFLTVPILNSAFNRPKKGIRLEDIIPEDLWNDVTQSEIDTWREILDKARK